jgi:hypothetical protein
MTRRVEALALTVALAAGCLLADPAPAAALPTLAPHQNTDGTIWFEDDGVKDGSSSHNHVFPHSVQGDAGPGHNHDAFAVWDNRTYRYDVGAATIRAGRLPDFWHGFIAPGQAPRYKFVDGNTASRTFDPFAEALIGAAILEWRTKAIAAAAGRTTPDGSRLVTGLQLSRTNGLSYEFRIGFFDNLSESLQAVAAWLVADAQVAGLGDDFAEGDLGVIPVLAFDDDVDWLFSVDPAVKPTGDQVDFFTTALHEIGHVLGLDHTPGVGDLSGIIMRARIILEATDGKVLRSVDVNSANGAAELYSQPVPAPSSLVIALAALGLLLATRMRYARHPSSRRR